MVDSFNRIRSTLTFFIAITYLSNLFIKSNFLKGFNLIFMAVIVILNYFHVTGTSKVISYVSFGISIILLVIYRAPLHIWEQAVQENLYFVVMFTLVPLLGIPIQYGGYFEALQSAFRRYVNTNKRFYLLVSFISAFVGILVNLAVVPLVNQVSKASDISNNKKLLSSAISRGFASCMFWAPTTAAIALIMQLTGAEWYIFFPFGILCGLTSGLIGYILILIEERRTINIKYVMIEKSIDRFNSRKIVELCIFSVILVSAIAIVSLKTGISTIIVVSLASLIYPIIWMAIIGRLPILFKIFKSDYFNESIPKIKNEIVLFVGAGLFVTSITYSNIGDYVPRILNILAGNNAFLLSIVVITVSIIFSSLGIHPIITVTIIGGTVNPASFGITSTYLAVILAICWAMGVSISPTSATVIALSGLTGQSTLNIGLYWNGIYVLISSFILILLLTILRTFGVI